MSKAVINALTMALVLDGLYGDAKDALDWATEFVTNNPELFAQQAAPQAHPLAPARTSERKFGPERAPGTWQAGDTALLREGTTEVSPRMTVAQRGSDGLTRRQRLGVEAGVKLCPNCQNPKNDHLPGCSRIPGSGTDRKAVTQATLAPTD